MIVDNHRLTSGRNFSVERPAAQRFKAKVAIKEQQTLSELAAKYELHANQIAEWKHLFQSSASSIFVSETGKKPVGWLR